MRTLLMDKEFFKHASNCLLFFFLLVIILRLGSDIFIPLTFSFILSFIVLPIHDKLIKWKFPNWISALIGIFLVMFILIGIFILLGYQLSGLISDLPSIKEKVNVKWLEIQKYIGKNWGITIREQNTIIYKQLNNSQNSNVIQSLFSVTTTLIAGFFLVPIISYFLLVYRPKFRKFLQLIDEKYHSHTCYIISEISKVSQSYLKGMGIDIIILTILNFIGLLALGIQYALLFAFMAAVLNIIPYIGVLVGSVIPIIMAFITKDSIWYAIGVLVVSIVVQFLDNNFIGPKVIGSSVSINPLASTIALLIGGLIWGTSGMILAIPLAGMLKVWFDNMPKLKPYGYLMGEEDRYLAPKTNLPINIIPQYKK